MYIEFTRHNNAPRDCGVDSKKEKQKKEGRTKGKKTKMVKDSVQIKWIRVWQHTQSIDLFVCLFSLLSQNLYRNESAIFKSKANKKLIGFASISLFSTSTTKKMRVKTISFSRFKCVYARMRAHSHPNSWHIFVENMQDGKKRASKRVRVCVSERDFQMKLLAFFLFYIHNPVYNPLELFLFSTNHLYSSIDRLTRRRPI